MKESERSMKELREQIPWRGVKESGLTVDELLALDLAKWPRGHPCRDCGAVFAEHPAPGCEGWR
jgi:hypothetical protein